METRSVRIRSLSGGGGVAVGIVGIVGCGLWVLGMVTPAFAQSVRNTVEERMDAGAAAVDSAADMASEETPPASQSASSEPSGEQPTEHSSTQVEPVSSDQPSSMESGDAGQPEAVSQSEPQADTASQAESPSGSEAEPSAPASNAPQQTETAASEPPSAPSPTTSMETAAAPDQVETAQSEAPSGPPSYTVMPGDTLWSISSQHLSDPFDWPKLWNVNPAVANPDLIYPGNILMLPNGQPVETVQAPPPPVAEAPPAEEAPEETAAAPAPAEEQQVIAEHSEEEQKAPEFEAPEPPPAQSNEMLALSSGYIAKNLPVAARVVGTHEYRVILGDHDTIYLLPSSGFTFEEKGHYTIYRRIKQVVHPVSGRVVGDLIRILGEVEVQEVGPVSTGVIVRSFDAIEPGDEVMPTQTVEAAPTEPVVEGAGGALSGLVLAVLGQHYIAGQFDVVYIDRGESSGVVVGDHFRVYKRGQRAPAYAPIANVQLPDRLVGEIEVLSVQGETATALLTRSTDTIALGDRIER
jgi:LysM repeat protein